MEDKSVFKLAVNPKVGNSSIGSKMRGGQSSNTNAASAMATSTSKMADFGMDHALMPAQNFEFIDLSSKFFEGEGILKMHLYEQITVTGGTPPKKAVDIENWHKQMSFNYLFNINYAFRAKTEAIFQNRASFYFDFFFVDDIMFEQHYLFQNLWRETLLLNYFDDKRVSKVSNFG